MENKHTNYASSVNPPAITEDDIRYALGVADKCIDTEVMNFQSIEELALYGLRAKTLAKMSDKRLTEQNV